MGFTNTTVTKKKNYAEVPINYSSLVDILEAEQRGSTKGFSLLFILCILSSKFLIRAEIFREKNLPNRESKVNFKF